MRGGEQKRERETQADSMLRAEPDTRLHLTTLRSHPELKPRVIHSTDRVIHCVIFKEETWLPGSGHFHGIEEKARQQVAGKLASQ